MDKNYKFRKGIEGDKAKFLEIKSLPNKAAVIAHAKKLARDNENNFVEIYAIDDERNEQIVAVVHTKVIDGINQFFGDGVYTAGVDSKVGL